MTYALMIKISKHGINEQASLAFLLQCGKGHSKPYLPKQNLIQQKSRFAKRGKKNNSNLRSGEFPTHTNAEGNQLTTHQSKP